MPIKWKLPKYSKIFENDQNAPKSKNYQNNLQNQKNDQSTPETQKFTKIFIPLLKKFDILPLFS